MTELIIDVRDLQKSFGTHTVVQGLNLEVAAGEVCGFLGANGSGKTTTIRMLCGLLTPDGGSGTCLGLDIVSHVSRIRRQVGYMTQRLASTRISRCSRTSISSPASIRCVTAGRR
jgi:ABC-type multidrug transport system ATPase subunit